MLISNLQQFLRLLVPPLAAAGINASSQRNVSGSLEALAEALEPFREMSGDQLAELLKVAQAYREAGELPEWVMARRPRATGTRTPKAPRAPKVSTVEVVARLRDLQERSSELTSAQVAEEVQGFAVLTAPQLKEVQKEFLGAHAGKTKAEQLSAIQKKIESFRASRDRVTDILAR